MRDKLSKGIDAGGIRPIVARWVITGEMILKTATHFGGEVETTVDMAVLRDPNEGKPLLPGTSLAGALRSHLADVLGGYRSSEHREVAVLFGAARSDDAGSQSPLIVFDSIGKLPENGTLKIRDGVALDPKTGTAEAHKKFDFEVLPAGTVFPIRLELIVEDPKQELHLLSLLTVTLKGLSEGDISLGMRRSRGLGAVGVVNWKAVRHDLTTPEGWLGWLTSDHEKPIGDNVPGYDSITEALVAACSYLNISEFPKDKRRRMLVNLELDIVGDLLVRSPAASPDAPDAVHICSAGEPVLPGTSLGGALRTQAIRIARLVRESYGDGDQWVDRIFGPRLESEETAGSKGSAMASKLRISESFIKNGSMRRQTRITIDRFTGGVVQGALFEEQVQVGGNFNVRLELRDPTDAEIGLVLLLVRDLLSGEIPVGGAVSVGRGILNGSARVSFPDTTEVYIIEENLRVEEKTREVFDAKIKAFCEAESLQSEDEKS